MQSLRFLKVKSLVALIALLSGTAYMVSLPASGSAAPIKLGVYVASQGRVGAPEDARMLDNYAEMVGRRPDIVMDYSNVTEPLLTQNAVSNLQARHETPLVTWQLYRSGWSGPTISLGEIVAGNYDRYLRDAADLARRLPFVVMIRFAHEMNGNWYGWSGDPSAYVEAWRHVVSVFRQQGAGNVRWVWAPNVDNGADPFSAYFPGDSWVDYVALDGYNWGTAGIGVNRWQSLHQVFASSYSRITRLSSKPVIISETASGEVGRDKPAWIRQGFLRTIPQRFPRVAAVVWFDRPQEEDWRINSSAGALNAYREVVASSLYGGPNPPPNTVGSAYAHVIALGVKTSKTIARSRLSQHANARASANWLFYRLSRRAGVHISIRGLDRLAAVTFSITIRRPRRVGDVPISRVAGHHSLPRGDYRVTVAAIDPRGAVSRPWHAVFRVV